VLRCADLIARIWHGILKSKSQAEEYAEYMSQTGVKDLQATQGNRGVYVLRRVDDTRAEFVFISLWESFDAVRRFAGEDVDKAVYYPRDSDFLVELEPKVTHFEVLVKP
jgi:heme-degrading monooxygenase HmoA